MNYDSNGGLDAPLQAREQFLAGPFLFVFLGYGMKRSSSRRCGCNHTG